LTALFITQGR